MIELLLTLRVSRHQKRRFSGIVADDCIHAARGKGMAPMGGAIDHSFISAHFLLSAYFLTAQTNKCMHLKPESMVLVLGNMLYMSSG